MLTEMLTGGVRWPTAGSELDRSLSQVLLAIRFLYVAGIVAVVAGVLAVRTELRSMEDGGGQFLAITRPVLWVLGLTTLIAMSSALLGGWTFFLIILSHFVVWYFYADRRLQRNPAPASLRDGVWKWLRGSSQGFRALHLGIAAVFLVLVAINHYAFREKGLLNLAVGHEAFYYWTLIHVTISFAPK